MKVGSACVVGRESSKQPPWSIEMSTSTEPGFIRDTSSLLMSFGALAPGDQHRADHQVGVQHRPLDLVGVGRDGLAVALVDGVHLAQPGDVAVQQQHLGLHAERDRGGVLAGRPRRRSPRPWPRTRRARRPSARRGRRPGASGGTSRPAAPAGRPPRTSGPAAAASRRAAAPSRRRSRWCRP